MLDIFPSHVVSFREQPKAALFHSNWLWSGFFSGLQQTWAARSNPLALQKIEFGHAKRNMPKRPFFIETASGLA
jgi:hypothetical protein